MKKFYSILAVYNENEDYIGFPGGSVVKSPSANVGDMCSIPGLGRTPGEENGNPLQYSWLGNSMDRGAWQATDRGVPRVRTQLINYLHYICYNIASALCFDFLAMRHVGS